MGPWAAVAWVLPFPPAPAPEPGAEARGALLGGNAELTTAACPAGAAGGGVLGPLKRLGSADVDCEGRTRAEAGGMPRELRSRLFFSTAAREGSQRHAAT